MIDTVEISNFRSIKDGKLELAAITFLYGHNAAGKSSILYALNIFKNVVSNPNTTVEAFFNLGFINLGNFKQIVYKHEENLPIILSIFSNSDDTEYKYTIKINNKTGEFLLNLIRPYGINISLPVAFPYPLNANTQAQFGSDGVDYTLTWTGVVAQVTASQDTEKSKRVIQDITSIVNNIANQIRNTDMVPLNRGFTKPNYGIVPLNGPTPTNEDQLASLLATDEYLDSKVSTYLESIIDRQFRAKTQAGTSVVALTTTEKKSKQTVDLVNDGSGINQLVYLLGVTLNRKNQLICIEEPEINLHPTVIRELPKLLVDLVKDDNKQLIISTHSEELIISTLALIAAGEIDKKTIAFYLTTKQSGVTNFERQGVNEYGQLEGGLTSFMKGELKDIKVFLRKSKKSNKSISESEVQDNNEQT